MTHFNAVSGKYQASAGFAFLWVLMLVAIMGIGLTVAVEMYSISVQRDKEKELLFQGRQFRIAIGRYYESQTGTGQSAGKREYPSSLEDLLRDNRNPGVKRHLRQIFVDPMTGKAEWGIVRISGRIVGVHSLSDKTPIKQDNFEAEDANFRLAEKYSDWVFAYPSDLLLRSSANKSENNVTSPLTQPQQTNSPPLQGNFQSGETPIVKGAP